MVLKAPVLRRVMHRFMLAAFVRLYTRLFTLSTGVGPRLVSMDQDFEAPLSCTAAMEPAMVYFWAATAIRKDRRDDCKFGILMVSHWWDWWVRLQLQSCMCMRIQSRPTAPKAPIQGMDTVCNCLYLNHVCYNAQVSKVGISDRFLSRIASPLQVCMQEDPMAGPMPT